jgi:hypothetical protein
MYAVRHNWAAGNARVRLLRAAVAGPVTYIQCTARHVLTCHADSAHVLVWDPSSPHAAAPVGVLDCGDGDPGETVSAARLCASPWPAVAATEGEALADGRALLLAVGLAGGGCQLWNTGTLTRVAVFPPGGSLHGAVVAVAVAGPYLASVTADHLLCVWSVPVTTAAAASGGDGTGAAARLLSVRSVEAGGPVALLLDHRTATVVRGARRRRAERLHVHLAYAAPAARLPRCHVLFYQVPRVPCARREYGLFSHARTRTSTHSASTWTTGGHSQRGRISPPGASACWALFPPSPACALTPAATAWSPVRACAPPPRATPCSHCRLRRCGRSVCRPCRQRLAGVCGGICWRLCAPDNAVWPYGCGHVPRV